MKQLIFFRLLIFGLMNCVGPQSIPGYSSSYEGLYAEFLEEGEVEIESRYNYVICKKVDGGIVRRQFFPETRQILMLENYNAELQLHGISKSWSNDGNVISMGNYLNGKKEGMWFTPEYGDVMFQNDQMNGIAVKYHKNGLTSEIQNFAIGKKDGRFAAFDSLGLLIRESYFSQDAFIKNENDYIPSFFKKYDSLPYDSACLKETDSYQRKRCSDIALMTHIQKTLRYPDDARQRRIEGTVVIQFTIKSNGSVSDINVLNGVSRSLKNEVIRVVKTFTDFVPAKYDGQDVDYPFTLPIKFKLPG